MKSAFTVIFFTIIFLHQWTKPRGRDRRSVERIIRRLYLQSRPHAPRNNEHNHCGSAGKSPFLMGESMQANGTNKPKRLK